MYHNNINIITALCTGNSCTATPLGLLIHYSVFLIILVLITYYYQSNHIIPFDSLYIEKYFIFHVNIDLLTKR